MRRVLLPVGVLLFVTNAIVLARVVVGEIRISDMHPKIQYYLTLQMEADLHGDPAHIKVFLPRDGEFQTIGTEKVESSRLSYGLVSDAENRLGVWKGNDLEGHERFLFEAIVDIRPRSFQLPQNAPVPDRYPDDVLRFLEPTAQIQSDAPEVQAVLAELFPEGSPRDISQAIRIIYDFVLHEIASSDYENSLDAVTALKWRKAFCGGKSRLLAALLRARGLPTRMVGGLILDPGSKRTTHVWVETWVNGVWVPFDALNDHFAEHPANYLVLYRGDHALFRRTENINFQYLFNVKKWRVPPDELLVGAGALNAYVLWESFRKAHISLNLLRIILLLPVGVLIVILFRNVIGVTTFGTFHPALMAVAFRDSGILWGALLYVSVLGLGLLIRMVLDRIQLLHTPRLAVVLIFVVAYMLCVTYLSVNAGILEPAHISMFPIAILTITVESYFSRITDLGHAKAFSALLQTLLVILVVYWVLDLYLVQTLVFAFPELLLGVAAAYLLLGRFVGMRLSEYGRFRFLAVE